jgi:hypothetical protein
VYEAKHDAVFAKHAEHRQIAAEVANTILAKARRIATATASVDTVQSKFDALVTRLDARVARLETRAAATTLVGVVSHWSRSAGVGYCNARDGRTFYITLGALDGLDGINRLKVGQPIEFEIDSNGDVTRVTRLLD